MLIASFVRLKELLVAKLFVVHLAVGFVVEDAQTSDLRSFGSTILALLRQILASSSTVSAAAI